MKRNLAALACLVAAPVILSGCRSNDGLASKSIKAPFAAKEPDLDMRLSVARVREKEGKHEQALEIYEQLLNVDPDNAEYRHRYGVVLCHQGRYEEGIEALRLADAQSPDDPMVLNDLGYACLVTGQLEVAREVLEATLEIDSRNERAVNNLATVNGYLGDYDQAYDLYQRIMTEAEALANLGYVATNRGDTAFATSCYSRALDLDGDMTQAKEALVQLADLDRRIEDRKAIVAASSNENEQGGVVHAAGAIPAGSDSAVQHAAGSE